ncbi:Immunity protein sdpI [Leminorella richardii]|uniref:Immunity protein sdpI n=1 Tax=Leminorella richardii TaxID=158841 RepID=A0A2X4XXY2_9GAMM|nr:SdpI family protein [Leminorella richardii]SQI41444.1 Immunity protein sdpI [Leminorella richardii]
MKKINLLTVLILLSSLIVVFLVTTLPDRVPIHLDMNGAVDQYSSKWFVLLGSCLASIATLLVQIYLRKTHNKAPEALQGMMSILLVVALTICWLPYVIATEFGQQNLLLYIGVFLGGLFIVMGNSMGLLKINSVVGFRVKWTMTDEEIWRKTHRFGGYVMVIAGILILISALMAFLFFSPTFLFIAILVITLSMVLTTTRHSYVLYKQKHKI